jgi:5'-deoxynucleotidase YfbR-like HD superfamily hydrolase
MGSVNIEGSIETVSGRFVSPLHSTVDDIEINDIAWALSRISRFAGHTITEIPYNVAQHSLFVCNMIEHEYSNNPRLALFGLLHDAAEAYIGDIPSPIKRINGLHEVFKRLENRLLDMIFVKYVGTNLSPDASVIVDFFDKRALYIEAHAFMESRGRDWCNYGKYNITLVDLQQFPNPIRSIEAYKEFIKKFNELTELIAKK